MQKLKTKETTIAREIALLFDEALFCGFRTYQKPDGRVAKIPVSKHGDGVSRDMSRAKQELVTAQEIIDGHEQLGEYWGIVLQDPIRVIGGDEVLTVLDLDAKHSDVPMCLQFKRLIELSKEMGLLFEVSHSGKGAHIIFIAKADLTLPAKIDLGNKQEIEIFGHPSSSGKSVLLTDKKMRGDINHVLDVREFLALAGIDVDKKPEPKPAPAPVTLQRRYNASEQYQIARDALEHMNPDLPYDDWVHVGMALVSEFGHDGEALWLEWSMTGNTWDESNIKKAKSFKGSGIGMGTFYHLAEQAGWQRPTRNQIERTTASQDFAQFINKVEAAKEDPAIAIEMASELIWKPVELTIDSIKGIDYLIDGFMAESFSIVAGQPGAGKTTAMVAMALIAAGFMLGDMRSQDQRKVIYVSEDPEQVRRILYAFVKFEGLDPMAIANKFVLIEARRVNAATLSKLRENVILETVDGTRPWLILDTASATMSLKDENDNAGVAEFVAALKEDIYLGLKTPVTVITHMAKATNRNDEDGQARGASAWEGDATLTATLFVDEGVRYLKLRKTRYEPAFREIRLETKQDNVPGIDAKGRMQDINLTWVIPYESDSDVRKIEKADKDNGEKVQNELNNADRAHTEFLKYLSTLDNPVLQVGAGRRKAPDGTTPVNLDAWLKDSGLPGTSKTDARRGISSRLKVMLGLGNVSGFVDLKVFVPNGDKLSGDKLGTN